MDILPTDIVADMHKFGARFGWLVSQKSRANKYQQTQATWQNLLNRGENLRQIITKINNLSPFWGGLEALLSSVITTALPTGILPAGINKINLYAISQWDSDVNSFQSLLHQIDALGVSGLTHAQIAETIKPIGLGSTLNTIGGDIMSPIKKIGTDLKTVFFIGVIGFGVYEYIKYKKYSH